MKHIILAAPLSATAGTIQATENSQFPDSHAPIGVMQDHTHNQGEWMFSYRFMTMRMEEMATAIAASILTKSPVASLTGFLVSQRSHQHCA